MKIPMLPLAMLLASALLLTSPPAVAAETAVVFSLQEIDCQSCGQSVAKMLQRVDGVRKATFDQGTAEVTVELGPAAPSAQELLARIHRAGYGAVEGAGEGRYLPAVEFPPGLDVEWLSRAGEEVDVEAGLVSGKVTVIDYYAIWCGPCRAVDEEMRRILASNDDVALRKVNVVDWSSPVAEQKLRNVSGLPYVEVYAKSGKRVAAVHGLDLERLNKAIEKGRSQ